VPPPAADPQAVPERKPMPGKDIVTNAVASPRYDAELEAWERLISAAARLCASSTRAQDAELRCRCGEMGSFHRRTVEGPLQLTLD
jgi:hypothetical protein